MPRGEDFVQVPQPAGNVASDIQHQDAVLCGDGLIKMIKGKRRQSVKSCIGDGLNGCRARKSFQDAHFAKKIAGRQFRELNFVRLAEVFADSDLPCANEEEPVSSFSFTYDDFARGSSDFFGPFPKEVQGSFIKASEDRHVV
jgi:hypothetical protein